MSKVVPTILLLGSTGQIGFDLRRSLAPLGHVVALGRSDCDLSNGDIIRRVVREVRPHIVVNAAAYTAVDQAEKEPQKAFAVNATAPGVLAEEAKALGSLLVHYSTDYVFDGNKDGLYNEEDLPGPLSVYAKSKLEGERAIESAGANAWVFRTSWVYSPHGHNFSKTILKVAQTSDRLRVVCDQFGAPTSSALIADVSAHALRLGWLDSSPRLRRNAFELFHLTAAGEVSWYEYACEVLAFMQHRGASLRVTSDLIEPIATSEFPTLAQRPLNSRLSTSKLQKAFGLFMPPWRDGLHHVLEQLSPG